MRCLAHVLIVGLCTQQMVHPADDPRRVADKTDAKVVAEYLLVISANYQGNFEILRVSTDGAEIKNLTNHPASDTDPAWSRDGQHIAFISDRDGTENLFVMDARSESVRQVTKGKTPCRTPFWSPDGTKIVYVNKGKDGLDQIFVVNVSSGKVRQLTSERFHSRQPAWSPDGKRLTYSHYVRGPYETYIMKVDGTGKTNLSRGGGLDAAWSPDGKKIAFTSIRGRGRFGVYVMEADGRNVKQLSKNSNHIGNVYPVWSPDGKQIAFTDMVRGVLQIAVVGADGSGYRVLTTEDSNQIPRWSPDGRKLIFARVTRGKTSLWVCNADGSNQRELLGGYQRGVWRPRVGR